MSLFAQESSKILSDEEIYEYAELRIDHFKNTYTARLLTGTRSKLVNEDNELLKRKDEIFKAGDPMEILNFLAVRGWKVNSFVLNSDNKRWYLLYKE